MEGLKRWIRPQLDGYRERLLVFGGVMYEQGLTQAQKNDLLKRLFADFQEFVAVTLYVNAVEQATVYDAHQLVEAGLDRGDLAAYRRAHPLPMDRIRIGEAYVENSTLSDKLLSLTLAIPNPSGPRDSSCRFQLRPLASGLLEVNTTTAPSRSIFSATAMI